MRRVGSLLLTITIALVSCSGDDEIGLPPSTTHQTLAPTTATAMSTTTTVAPVDSGPAGVLSEWDGMRATLTVPLDRADPDGPTIDVPVWRREASDPEKRIGVLLVNPGGPGVPANWMAVREGVFTDDLYTHFDIVALDPRGTFPQTEIHCPDRLGEYISSVDWTPDSLAEVEAVDSAIQGMVDDCVERYGHLLQHVSTMDTVHDMAALVAALEEEQVSYLGWSYGSALGAAFVTEYPHLVRAAVFDAAYHPRRDPFEDALAWWSAVETSLVAMFEECDGSSDCRIQEGAQAAFERVSATADATPYEINRFFPVINQEAFWHVIVRGGVLSGDDPGLLLAAVAAADNGDATPLSRLYLATLDEAPLGDAISCVDDPYRGPTPLPDDMLESLQQAAPTFYAIFPPGAKEDAAVLSMCERWPAEPELLPSPLSGEGAGPILVVTATGDANTPAANAVALADELVNSTLLTVEDDRHVSYDAAYGNDARTCATSHIDMFLIDLTGPSEGTICGP